MMEEEGMEEKGQAAGAEAMEGRVWAVVAVARGGRGGAVKEAQGWVVGVEGTEEK